MMKKMITLASLAFMLMAAPTSMQAQNIVNADAKVDAKAAKKAEKERLKQEKKAAKEKAKAAKLVAKDATNAAVGTTASVITNEFKNEKPALLTAGDSTAYLFGISQSNGLKAYLVNQMNVDTAYLNTFARGVMDRVSIDPADKELHAYNAGLNIGGQVEQMTQQFSNDYYKANPESKIDPRIVASAIIAGLTGQSEMSSEDAMNKFREIMTERQKQNMEAMYGENRKAGELFLEQNKKKPGVITLPSGLQYKVLTEGKGEIPDAESIDKLTVQLSLVLLVYGLVFLLMYGIQQLDLGQFGVKTLKPLVWGFNFLWGTLIGVLVRWVIGRLRKSNLMQREYINNHYLDRIAGTCFDVMIVAGTAAIDFNNLRGLWLPLVLVCAVGALVTFFYVLRCCRRLYPDYQYEGFFSMFGMLTGTASNGMILLREIDPRFETPAANNLVLQTIPALAFGFPVLLLMGFAPQSLANTLITMGIMVAALLLFAMFIFRKTKKH